jgi:hypothetical protein
MVRIYLFQVGRAALKDPFSTLQEKDVVTFSLSPIEITLPTPHSGWLVCYAAMLPLTVNKRFDPFGAFGVRINAPQRDKLSLSFFTGQKLAKTRKFPRRVAPHGRLRSQRR